MIDNTFQDNDAWGAIMVPYPDSGKPCTGGVLGWAGSGTCLFDESGDALLDNTFAGNGSFANPTNGDFALTNFEPGATDCFSGNVEQGGGTVTSTPGNAEQEYPTCNGQTVAPSEPQAGQFTNEVLCDSQASLSPAPSLRAGPPTTTRALEGRDAPAAQASGDDAEPVRGRSRESLVHGPKQG